MITFGSVCSGIGAPELAWRPLGWRSAFMSEIDPFPRAVLAHHYPEVPLHGDFTTIEAGQFPDIDVLVGGTPCQSFSVAGLQGGLADERGNLALEFLRLADRLRPRWVVWENVPGVRSSGGGRDFGAFLGGLGQLGYGWAYASLDAQYRGLAQRRERVFVVGYLGDWRYPAAVLFEPACLRWDTPPGREAGEGVAATIEASLGRRGGVPNDHDPAGGLIAGLAPTLQAGGNGTGGTRPPRSTVDTVETLIPSISPALKSRDFKGPSSDGDGDGAPLIVTHALRADGFDASEDGTGRGTPLVPVAFNSREDAVVTGNVAGALGASSPQAQAVAFSAKDYGADAGHLAPTLRAMGHAGSHPNAGGQVAVSGVMGVRRLTPRECERLMGFPDDFTLVPYRGKPAKDGPRYRALGNSMAVPIMRWIGERISAVDAYLPQARHAA